MRWCIRSFGCWFNARMLFWTCVLWFLIVGENNFQMVHGVNVSRMQMSNIWACVVLVPIAGRRMGEVVWCMCVCVSMCTRCAMCMNECDPFACLLVDVFKCVCVCVCERLCESLSDFVVTSNLLSASKCCRCTMVRIHAQRPCWTDRLWFIFSIQMLWLNAPNVCLCNFIGLTSESGCIMHSMAQQQ